MLVLQVQDGLVTLSCSSKVNSGAKRPSQSGCQTLVLSGQHSTSGQYLHFWPVGTPINKILTLNLQGPSTFVEVSGRHARV